MILAQCTGTNHERLDLRFHPGGKPYLHGGSGIEFNLSHSHDMLVVAVSCTPLGVDLEAIRPVPYALTVAEHWFAPVEYAACLNLRGQDREFAFLRLWTRKEAYLKARGEGLQRALNSFAVTAEEETPRLLWDGSCS